MPSLRSNASSAPRLPLARASSAALTSRSFSDAVNCRRVLLVSDSCDALFARALCGLRSPSAGALSGPGTWGGLGTLGDPFSDHRYKDIGGRLSQATLAQRASAYWPWRA